MELRRRTFLSSLGRSALVFLAGALAPAIRIAPRRFVEAVRGRWYPGPVVAGASRRVREQGKWAG